MPDVGPNGCSITWESSNEDLITTDGTVNRPLFSETMGEYVYVTITATISKGEVSLQKTLQLSVIPYPPTIEDEIALAKEWLTYDVVLNGNRADDVKTDLNLVTETPWYYNYEFGFYGDCLVTWESSDPDVITVDGTVTRPEKNTGYREVTLTATISKNDVYDTKTFYFVVREVEEIPLAVSHNGFSNTSRLQFNGVSGTVETTDGDGNNIIALQFNNDRRETGTVGGSIFTKNKICLGEDLSFSTAFSYRNPHPGFITGTGGITFTLQAAGNTVYGSALQDESIKPGINIAFVTDYYTVPGPGQATTYMYMEYAEVYYNGNYENRTSQKVTYGNTLDPAKYYNVWIEYNGTGKVLEIHFSTDAIRPKNSNLRIENLDLAEILTGAGDGLDIEDVREVYAGFMGSWGNAKDKSEIYSWYFKNDSIPIDFKPYDYIDASTVILSANPPAGRASSTITAQVYGLDGTPAAGIPVNFSTTMGSLDVSKATTNESGYASVVLLSSEPGTATVKVLVPGGATASTQVQLTVTDEDRLAFDVAWLTYERILGQNSSPSSITDNLNLPSYAPNGSTISWESSKPDYVNANGEVTRPSIEQGHQALTLTATISLGTFSIQKTFDIKVKVRDEDLAAADRDWLTGDVILNGNESLDMITTDLYLPQRGENGSIITWTSGMPEFVDGNGVVNRPSYSQGNKQVTLTATIKSGPVTLEKKFNITVIKLEATDEEAAYAGFVWLTDEIILGENEALDRIMSDLNLPVTGILGTEIRWESSDTEGKFVAADGTVNRPTYTQGPQNISLVATISRGSAEYTKTFHITVIPLPTDDEALELDANWLTYEIIIGGGGIEITNYLNLPVEGPYGSSISWTSSDEKHIKPDGTITRPSFAEGNKLVYLTAVLSKGGKSTTKTFNVVVVKLDQTDADTVELDLHWLINYHNILGDNLSKYSVISNLSLPTSGPYGSVITWTSDTPSTISNGGEVTRPEYYEGHKNVVLTVTVAKGDATESFSFGFTVLTKPDTFAPVVLSTEPANNSTGAPWNTKEITITFDEDIKAKKPENSTVDYGIVLNGPGAPDISVALFRNTLTVMLADYMKPGKDYELVVPSDTITDSSGNDYNNETRVAFSVEEKPERIIEVVFSSPGDREKDVPCETNVISIEFNYDVFMGDCFDNIALLDSYGRRLKVSKWIYGRELTLTLDPEVKLQPAQVYEVFIPGDAVKDRFENSNLRRSVKFRTESSSTLPYIVDFYPKNGQMDVDINQPIYITFSQPIDNRDHKLVLLDSRGNSASFWAQQQIDQNTFAFTTYSPLKPNTTYTLKGPYDVQDSGEGMGFEISFTTGSNAFSIADRYAISKLGKKMPINSPVEIQFSDTISEGTEFDNIKVMDLKSNEVEYTKSINNNKLVLAPNSPLNPSDGYLFFIPKGALKNTAGKENDSLMFDLWTASPFDYGDFYFGMPSLARSNLYYATWVTNQILEFDSRRDKFGRPIKSLEEWDFGNGKKGVGPKASTIYYSPGEYKVALTMYDYFDIPYNFERTITIIDLNLDDAVLSVEPYWTLNLTVYDENNEYGIKNIENFKISLKSPSIGYIHNQRINVSLYKNGTLIENLGTVATEYNNETQFSFSYGNKGYYGAYELVFEHDETKKQVRVPVRIHEATSGQSLTIKLYDEQERRYITPYENMYFVLDGKKVLAWREADSNAYVISGLETGRKYSLTLPGEEHELYVSNKVEVYHQGSDHPVWLNVRKKQPGINYIRFELSESGVGSLKKGIFIKGVEIPGLQFEISGNWDGLTPGYYELKSSMGSISRRSVNPVFELQPGLQMKPGEELLGRMVSVNGVESPWVNANVIVAPYPELEYGPKLDITYEKGRYVVSTPLKLSKLTGGNVDILDDVPLIDGGSFGLGDSKHGFEGFIDQDGYLVMEYQYGKGLKYSEEQRTELSKKLAKVVSAGFDVEANVSFYGVLKFNKYTKEWKLVIYELFFNGNGEYFWKRAYVIPKINIGGWGKISMGANINGKLAIKGFDKDFEGILGFDPYVTIEIGAGIDDTLSVEGYVTGHIPAEFHIPTGYIQVEPYISAGIVAYYIFDSVTLYEKKLAGTHWDNGKEKVKLLQFMADLEEDIEFTPIPTNYLERGSHWLAGNSAAQRSMRASSEKTEMLNAGSNPQIRPMANNIYPRAEVQLASGDNKQWLIWTEHNPVRDDNNRTQLKYSMFDGTSWCEPEWFGNQDTADFASAAAASGDGLLLAWQNIKNLMTEENKKVSYVKDSEIKVTRSVFKGEGEEPDIITLTDDDKFDHAPVLAADGGKALLVWIKSEGLSITYGDEMKELRSPANTDSLYFSFWDGSNWSAPEEIEGSLPYIYDSILTMRGTEGLLLYTLDMDNDLTTQDDREVYYRLYDGTAWGEAVRLSVNDVEDSAPRAANINGEWFVIWHQNGDVVYKTGLGEEVKSGEFHSNIPAGYRIAVMEGENPQLTLIYVNAGENNTNSLAASFYDINKSVWSGVIALGENEGYIRSFSPVFTEEGTLKVVYTQAVVIKEVVEDIEYFMPSDKVDLMMLSYTPFHDLSFDEENGLLLVPTIPVQGAQTKIWAVVNNNGDFAENATLYVYDGEPDEGRLIGIVETQEPVPARRAALMELNWQVGLEERDKYKLYAVIRTDEGINEADESNNYLTLEIVTADVAVKALKCENIAGNDYLVHATVANTGGKILEDVSVQLVHVESGEILESRAIDSMMDGEEIGLSFLFSPDGLEANEDGETVMALRVLLPAGTEEFSTENNAYNFTLVPVSITVEKVYPAPNETRVSTDKPLTIGFNMDVDKGAGFEQIELIDEKLNEIEIYKTIEGNTLTITPRSPLARGTGYTLTIPADAVSDPFGHKMDEPYSLSFVTTASNPEITLAYPGNGMADVAPNTEIKVRYNQNVTEGPNFGNIALYQAGVDKVPAHVSIEGEWLYIKPSERLQSDTEYTLVIPAGAVLNANSEVQQEYYELAFTTGTSDDSGNDDEDDDDDNPPDDDPGDNPDDNPDDDNDNPSYGGGSITPLPQQDNNVSRDGNGTVIIDILQQDVLIADDKADVIIDLTDELKDDEVIKINLSGDILKKLADNAAGLQIVTGKGDIYLPAVLVDSLAVVVDGSITVNIEISTGTSNVGTRPAVQISLTQDGKEIEKQIKLNSPGNTFMVTIPYTPSEEELENSESIIIRFIDDSGNHSVVVDGCYDPETGTVTFKGTRFGRFTVDFNNVDFTDVVPAAWYSKAVKFIAARGITKGTGDGKNSPDLRLTRGEFITMLMRTYNIAPDENPADNFIDAGNAYYTGYLAAAKRLGISNGVGENKFMPEKEITREEMFTLLYRALKLLGQLPELEQLQEGNSVKTLESFLDSGDIAPYAREAIEYLVKVGAIKGNNSMLMPKSITTRAEIAQLLYNILHNGTGMR